MSEQLHRVTTDGWHPQWVVHPGWMVREELDELRLPQTWLAQRAGLTPKHINRVIRGHANITGRTSVSIGVALGWSPYILARMQADFDVGVALGYGLLP